ncbi:hypothetical protein Back11_35150 [Paenibacillus baekrokdamisoli]|uniref:Uncharacterized protein n=1 Tax=Paenibacillus baekrokdamisoli TaxID=1712516 RepID=A0A3G9ITG9_9BACL|nr:hypothetical protein Back11_35150 [Paenibacillus baekrokdamisoli]
MVDTKPWKKCLNDERETITFYMNKAKNLERPSNLAIKVLIFVSKMLRYLSHFTS